MATHGCASAQCGPPHPVLHWSHTQLVYVPLTVPPLTQYIVAKVVSEGSVVNVHGCATVQCVPLQPSSHSHVHDPDIPAAFPCKQYILSDVHGCWVSALLPGYNISMGVVTVSHNGAEHPLSTTGSFGPAHFVVTTDPLHPGAH